MERLSIPEIRVDPQHLDTVDSLIDVVERLAMAIERLVEAINRLKSIGGASDDHTSTRLIADAEALLAQMQGFGGMA